MAQKRKVVITGIGLLSPCGLGWEPFWDAATRGQSAIHYIQSLSLNGFPSKLAGEVKDFDPSKYVQKRKSIKVMSRTIQLAVGASAIALQDSRIELDEKQREVFGVSLGSGVINNDLDELAVGLRLGFDEEGEFQMTKFGQSGIRALYPLWFLKYLPNMPACHISIAHGLKGPSNTITTSAAAGAHAIGEAFRIIERGDADFMLAGSSDSKINAQGISRFHLLGLLSQRNSVPEKVYCPFDKEHDGLILGEGSGMLVLEDMESAQKRGAQIYGEIVGYGSSTDYNVDPREEGDWKGKRRSMQLAIEDAGMQPEDVDLVIANGSGIPQEDIQEAKAIQDVFGPSPKRLNVTGLKPITGHLVYGAAGVEFSAGLLALKSGTVPPLINLHQPDTDCELPFVGPSRVQAEPRSFLMNTFGFGGQCATLVVRKI